MLQVNSRIRIPDSEFKLSFARSSGPGGQNVNKVNSKAVLRWRPDESAAVPSEVLERFRQRFASRLTTTGDLVLTSERYRDQARNVADVREKLRAMLSSVSRKPKARRATKPTAASVERRKRGKQVRSRAKQLRRSPVEE